MDKVRIPQDLAVLFEQQYDLSERKELAEVISRLELDLWRDTNKLDWGEVDGVPTWAVADGGFTVIFAEEEDSSITVLGADKRSRFRPGWL